VLENLAKIATHGRGLSAVKAGELVLAYAEGKPIATFDVTARRGPDASAFAALGETAVGVLERALAESDAGITVSETVAPDGVLDENPSGCAAIDVDAGPAGGGRGQGVANRLETEPGI
jgi:hypothetical protein